MITPSPAIIDLCNSWLAPMLVTPANSFPLDIRPDPEDETLAIVRMLKNSSSEADLVSASPENMPNAIVKEYRFRRENIADYLNELLFSIDEPITFSTFISYLGGFLPNVDFLPEDFIAYELPEETSPNGYVQIVKAAPNSSRWYGTAVIFNGNSPQA